MKKSFSDEEDEHLLYTLHSLTCRQTFTEYSHIPYSRIGNWWKFVLGFQHIDPISDIRGCGLLSLHNLIYFLTHHPRKASMMIKSRAGNPVTTAYSTFPWACAGINLTRVLAEEYEICQASGLVNVGDDVKYSKKTSWSYVTADNGFNRMFVCLFLLLDYFWNDMHATYMEFNHVLKEASNEFKIQLALSTSLTNLENRIHKRIGFIDPDIKDYTSLPEPTRIDDESHHESFRHLSSFVDAEDQSYAIHQVDIREPFSSRNCINDGSRYEYSILEIFTNHMPSYDAFVSSLVPVPADSMLPTSDLYSDVVDTTEINQSCQLHCFQHQPPPSLCMQMV